MKPETYLGKDSWSRSIIIYYPEYSLYFDFTIDLDYGDVSGCIKTTQQRLNFLEKREKISLEDAQIYLDDYALFKFLKQPNDYLRYKITFQEVEANFPYYLISLKNREILRITQPKIFRSQRGVLNNFSTKVTLEESSNYFDSFVINEFPIEKLLTHSSPGIRQVVRFLLSLKDAN